MRLKLHDYNSSFDARSRYYNALIGDDSYYGTDSQNIQLLDFLKSHGYAKGTKHVGSTGTFLTQEQGLELIGNDRDGLLTPLSSNDSVFNNGATSNLYDFANNPIKYITDITSRIPAYTSGNSSSGVSIGDINTTLSLPNIQNYEDFINKAQSDPRFEKLVQTVTIGNALGNNRLLKYGI